MTLPPPEPLVSLDDPDWLRLRIALWPDGSAAEHLAEMASFLAEPERYAQFIVREPGNGPGGTPRALGFAEAAIRHDYVPGTESSPVAFLEGLFVVPEARRRGVARALVRAVADWGRARGCEELASDTPLENTTSQAVHAALGFTETERIVCYAQRLGD